MPRLTDHDGLENDTPVFNAGYGSALCADGSVELIAVDAHGNVTTPMSTGAMPRGVSRAGQNPVTTVP